LIWYKISGFLPGGYDGSQNGKLVSIPNTQWRRQDVLGRQVKNSRIMLKNSGTSFRPIPSIKDYGLSETEDNFTSWDTRSFCTLSNIHGIWTIFKLHFEETALVPSPLLASLYTRTICMVIPIRPFKNQLSYGSKKCQSLLTHICTSNLAFAVSG
jgi:hypothetical protein